MLDNSLDLIKIHIKCSKESDSSDEHKDWSVFDENKKNKVGRA